MSNLKALLLTSISPAAEWELTPDPSTQRSQRSDDWQKFANSVGHRELARLDRAGVMYRVPPPGAL